MCLVAGKFGFILDLIVIVEKPVLLFFFFVAPQTCYVEGSVREI